MLTKENFINLIECCTTTEFLDDTIFKAFAGIIGQAEFENVFLVYDVLLSESRFRGAKDGMNFIIEILRNTSLMSEEKYNLLK